MAWMRGAYPSYLDYRTSITTLLLTGGNTPPVADAEVTSPGGPAPLEVGFDARGSTDTDGTVVAHEWDFGDRARGAGAQPRHRYAQPGRFFPVLTLTDDRGETDTFVTEVTAGAFLAPDVATGPAITAADGTVTLRGAVNPHNQPTTYHFEYGPTSAYGVRTPEQALADPGDSERAVHASITGLTAGATYHV